MDSLIKALSDSGNLAVIVLVLANGGLLWLVRSLLSASKEQATAWAAAEKAQAEADLKLAEAITLLRVEITRGKR